MTNPNRTLIAVLLDRSGSMQAVKADAEGGFAAFVEGQRDVRGEAVVTLARFDTEYEVVYANRPLADVPPLDLQPRGGTALYDAVGRLVTDVGTELAAMPEDERPGMVVVVILTDGHENSSTEWTHDAIRALIQQQETTYSWEFLFLGANMDAVQIGTALGVQADRSLTWEASGDGVATAMALSSRYVARRRAAPVSAPVVGFTEDDRAAARGGRP